MNLFTQVPEWLRAALGTTEPPLPNHLETDHVQPVIDVFRGGAAQVIVEALEVTKAASLGSSQLTLISHGVGELRPRLLIAIEAQASGYGVAPVSELRYRSLSGTVGQINVGAYLHDPAAAALGNVGHLHQYNGGRPVWIPPQWGLVLATPATGVGETWTVQYAVATFPRGSELGV